ncbi:FAS1 domain-containing protein [Kalaharituber pfeilii]|nr:FAS1 domain-containing protein [Kalaharituber pfeilii]
MKYLTAALIVAAVVVPRSALGFRPQRQVVFSEDALTEELYDVCHNEVQEPTDAAEGQWGIFEEGYEAEDWSDLWRPSSQDRCERYSDDDEDSLPPRFRPPPPPSSPPYEAQGRPGHRKPKHPGKGPCPGRPGREPHHRPGRPPRSPRPPPGHRHPDCPGHGPHHPIRTNQTIYELISKSEYTTKIFDIIKNDTELSDMLKSTESHITFFVPTNKAFENIPYHPPHHNSSHAFPKELIKKALLYHISPDVYDSRKLWTSNTIPSALKSEGGIGKGEAQRLRIGASFTTGIRINVVAKIIAGDIFATNGVIHGLDNFIFLPPFAETLLEIVPTEFSTTAFALTKTGLAKDLPDGPKTFFAPSNRAWYILGFKINAFLFSKYGEKYLAALLKYHVAPGKVLYSDYVIEPKKEESKATDVDKYHAELDTLLGDKKIIVDIWKKDRWVKWIVNKNVDIVFPDAIVRDGVIQVAGRVLIPPCPGKPAERPDEPLYVLNEDYASEEMNEEEMTLEELKERLEPYL